MFERDENIDFKIPIMVVVCLVVLGGGIYFGINSSSKEQEAMNMQSVSDQKQIAKPKEIQTEVFALSETCEIWLKKGEENSMIGMIPNELLNKSENEIRAYLQTTYPDRNIESITYGQIVLSENPQVKSDKIKNKYSLEVENGLIGVYKYDINGNRSIEKETSIKIDLLPQSVQEQIQQGIIVDTLDEAYVLLENLSS